MSLTYSELQHSLRGMLRLAGIEESGLEARRLLAHAAQCSEAQLISRGPLYASDEVESRLQALAKRRIAGEPLAYICGWWEFYGRRFVVNSSVLIPRMDTEILIDVALDKMSSRREPRVLDLCCGSGCIGCVLGDALPASRIVLADISPEALSVARRNVSLHNLGSRCICMDGDALSPPPLRMENFDLLVCNPPYIAAQELAELDSSVRDWEPELALDGGEDGLIFYSSVITNWKSVLKDGGFLIFEVGEGQAKQVLNLMHEADFTGLGSALDTAGTERVVFGQKQMDKLF